MLVRLTIACVLLGFSALSIAAEGSPRLGVSTAIGHRTPR